MYANQRNGTLDQPVCLPFYFLMRPVHFIFSPSAAVSLRSAMSTLGPSPEVVALFEDLSFGPLQPQQRLEWWQEKFYSPEGETRDDEQEIWCRRSRFWELALAADVDPFVWLNRNSPQEMTGFLSFVSKTGGRRFRLFDVTHSNAQEATQGSLTQPVCISQLLSRDFTKVLLQCSNPARASSQSIEAWGADWEKILSENSVLRVVDSHGRLISVHESYFDEWILRSVGVHWTKAARVAGDALGAFDRERHQRMSDLYALLRLYSLAENGALEVEGTLGAFHEFSVRLPTQK
jgi:hypothetical protein